MDSPSLLAQHTPADADELVHWLKSLNAADFRRVWVPAVTLYVHDEEALTGEFPLHDLVRILLGVQECYWQDSDVVSPPRPPAPRPHLNDLQRSIIAKLRGLSKGEMAEPFRVTPRTVNRVRQRKPA